MAACGCCAALKPRYKRLVDGIFPADPQEGLVKSNMDKLTFFAMKSPEKLDRIGEYLAQRLSRDVSRQRIGFVVIAMEALDTLLVTCHAQSLNLFVESFLKMVQKLLECNEPELQSMATSSFIKFANIEEDTPSYHRRYDFFVSKFSSMCHNSHANQNTRDKLRVTGLRGLQGVVRKTVSDDLQVNIWEQTHMDKIIPSLLFNMQLEKETDLGSDVDSPKDEQNPAFVAETVFRDLVCRATFGNINAVIKPVLTHLDNHELWVPNEFAVKCFKIIMYSVQAQYGYVVVQMLMNHLDEHSKKDPKIKSSIVEVLYETVLIAAGGSIGPAVLEVFNTLLKHLRVSVDSQPKEPIRAQDEKNFQEAIINTIGEFANHLPDYQKIENLMFVMGKVPLPRDEEGAGDPRDVVLQTMLMKTTLKVATKYKTVLMTNAFPNAFLEPLLRMSLVKDTGIRRIVQEILHTLLDRHDNLPKLMTIRSPADIAEMNLSVEKPPRQDIMFMKKNGNLFYWHIYENMLKVSNRVDNFETLYRTMALLSIEVGGEEILIELFRLALGIQQATAASSLPITHKCAIHACLAAYMNLMSQLTAIPALVQHVRKVIKSRQTAAPAYLPERAFDRGNTANSYPDIAEMDDSWLFDREVIAEAFSIGGNDVSRLAAPSYNKPMGIGRRHRSASSISTSSKKDTVDMGNLNMSDKESIFSVESVETTPKAHRKFSFEAVTVDSLRRILDANPSEAQERLDRKRKAVLENFTTGPFEEIVARSEERAHQFHSKLNEILENIAFPNEGKPHLSPSRSRFEEDSFPFYEMKFPEMFVY